MAKMNSLETSVFLEESNIAHLVTLREDGTPHVSPIWYKFIAGYFAMFTPAHSIKFRNLHSDRRASISVASYDEPYRYVVAEGLASLNEQKFDEIALAIASRYRGIERGKAFVDQLKAEYEMGTILLKPERFMTYRAN